MRPSFLALLGLLVVRAPAVTAQQFFTPGAEVNGQISVQVTGTLNDGSGDYHPLANQSVTLYRGAADSLVLMLDGAGVLKFAVAPGTYRIASATEWRGRAYRWNLALPVRQGMGTFALTADNAVVTAIGPRRAGPARAQAMVVTSDDAASEPRLRSNKDGSTATLWSLLFTGAGQIYAGETGKGVALLVVGEGTFIAGLAAASASQNSALYGNSNSGADGAAVALLITGTTLWVYSLVDAHSAVHRYNDRHGYAVQPFVAPGVERSVRTGLAFSLR
jgi:hypothetical protein